MLPPRLEMLKSALLRIPVRERSLDEDNLLSELNAVNDAIDRAMRLDRSFGDYLARNVHGAVGQIDYCTRCGRPLKK